MNNEHFARSELDLIARVQPMIEQLVGEHFRLTSFGPYRRCYEVVTLSGADDEGRDSKALAKLCRYDRKERPLRTGGVSRFYKVCLQDGNLLARARLGKGITLRALLCYVLAHELIHVVRFESYEVCYHVGEEARAREEETVHLLTAEVLAPLRDAEIASVVEGLSKARVDVVL